MSKTNPKAMLLSNFQKLGNTVSGIRLPNMGKGKFLSGITIKNSLLVKLAIVFLLLIIIPVSVIGVISTNTASSALINKTEDSVALSTLQTSNYIDRIMSEASNTSLEIFSSPGIQKLGDDIQDHSVDPLSMIQDQQNANNFIMSINNSTDETNICVLYSDGSLIGGTGAQSDMDKIKATSWYKQVWTKGTTSVWTSSVKELNGINGNYPIELVRSIKSVSTNEPIAMSFIYLKYTTFANILKAIHVGDTDQSYLITSTGIVLSAKGEQEEPKIADRAFVKKVIEAEKIKAEGLLDVNDQGVNYLVSYHQSGKTNWTAITMIPKKEVTNGASAIRNTTIIFGIIFAILALLFGLAFSYKMTEDMKKLMRVMSKAEEGDLTVSVRMKRKDEIGVLAKSFNSMLNKIRDLVVLGKELAVQVGQASDNMSTTTNETGRMSQEVTRAITEVAAGSSNQASEVENSVRYVSMLADKIGVAVQSTRTMDACSNDVRTLTTEGINTIDSLNKKAVETNEITSNVVTEIVQLNDYVKSINKITKILQGVADQTNLLALNAAIEAARAGEAGQGFAVVADEVRKLADKSNSNTREIQALIGKIQQQAQNSTDMVGLADARIKEQSEMIKTTAEVFSRINGSIDTLSGNIQSTGEMIAEMDNYKEQVLSSIENMSSVTEETVALTEEVSASTEEQLSSFEELKQTSDALHEAAQSLVASMEKFQA